MFISSSRQPIIKGVKLHLRNSGGLGDTLFKNCYRTTIFWYAEVAPTGRKCFIARDCASSHPDNHYPMYKLRHKHGNPIRKWEKNKIFCKVEDGNVITRDHFSTPITIMRRHSVHPKLQCEMICQPKNHGTHQEPYESVPQKVFPKRMNYVTQQTRIHTRNLMRKQEWKNLTLLRLTPAVRITIYVTTQT